MDFVRDSLKEQQKLYYIKYCLFHDVIAVVKFTILKLKTMCVCVYIYIYIYISYFITSISKAFLTKHIKLFFIQPQFQPQF
jgi:hypothetical protein